MNGSLSTGQVAKELGVSVSTARRLMDGGKLKSWRIPGGKYRRVNREELDRYKATLSEDSNAYAQSRLQRRTEAAGDS